jgi:hypothetical protein
MGSLPSVTPDGAENSTETQSTPELPAGQADEVTPVPVVTVTVIWSAAGTVSSVVSSVVRLKLIWSARAAEPIANISPKAARVKNNFRIRLLLRLLVE